MSSGKPTGTGAGARLLALWRKLKGLPGGRWLFAMLFRLQVPYSGTIGARVQLLEPGHAKVTMRDRRAVRNHLRSVHAIALANLGELTSGLAALSGLPANVRGIPTKIEIEYFKKARGLLTAECRCELPEVTERTPYLVSVDISDPSGDVVSRVTATWLLEPAG